MNSILYELFTNCYDTTPAQDKTQQILNRRILEEWEKIETALSREFAEHLAALEGERECRQNFQYYRSGFSLGVRLMLEVLGGASVSPPFQPERAPVPDCL